MKVLYSQLSESDKKAVAKRLVTRKLRYLSLLNGKLTGSVKVLLVGDRPGPAAPTDPTYHHTPFYSTKHCSGWLNACLHLEGIAEDELLWINAYDREGNPADFSLLKNLRVEKIVALGGNAEKWLKQNGVSEYYKVSHPQFHKRFKSSERYELLDKLVSR